MSAIENPCSRLEKLIKTLASSIFKQIGINNNAGNNNGIIYSFRREDYSRFIGELKESNLAEINLKTLESDVTRLVDSSEEVFQHDPKNIYVVADKCVTTEKDTYIPLVYNVLCVIFSQTNQKERLCYYHHLLQYFYNELKELLMKIDIYLPSNLPLEYFEHQVKQYLPYVKLVKFKKCFSNVRITQEERSEALLELNECLQYPNILREDCYMIVGNKLRSNDYELRSYQLIPLTERLGFLGDYYKLKINVAYDKNVETLNLFAKYLPTTNETTLEIALLSSNKERFIYQTFIPMLKQLGYGDITDFSPECYFARPNDVLVLEDVSILDYTSSDIFTSASYEWLSMASKQLAKFHACSILLEEKMSVIQGETFGLDQEYGAYLKEVNFTEDSSGMVMRHGAKVVTEFFLVKFPEVYEGMELEVFRKRVGDAFSRIYADLAKSKRFRNVICHGDMWGSNILTKQGQGKPHCLLIDYQLTRYCPPATDLLFLLFTNTDRETRGQYFWNLVNEYYEELSRIMRNNNINMNNICDRETFLESCKYFKSSAICQSACYLQILLCPKEKMREINDSPEKSSHFYLIDRTEVFNEALRCEPFRKRMKEIVEELYEMCQV